MGYRANTHHLLAYLILVASINLMGCGSVLDPQGILTDTKSLFPEDADPAYQALEIVDTELLLQPLPGADATSLADLFTQLDTTIIDQDNELGLITISIDPDMREIIATALIDSGLIESVHKNYILPSQSIPNDPLFRLQPHLPQVNATEAWDITTGDEDMVIGVVDSGIDISHPDLRNKILDGYNIFDASNDYDDIAGHGTQVAGIIAAESNNRRGVVGLAWDSPIVAVKATNENGDSTSRHLAAGIMWAQANGAKVINVSFAPLWSNKVIKAAAQHVFNRGGMVVISAGNAGGKSKTGGYPEALFVGAVDGSDRIAAFSDRGPFVDLVAPGVSIQSTSLGSGYRTANGTSFAAPIVSGIVALAWSANPSLRPATIQSILSDTAIDLGSRGKDSTYGYGLIDAAAVVQAAADTIAEPDNKPPTVRITSPSAGSTLSGRSRIVVSATDRWGVADVVMSIDGVPTGTDTRKPYRFVVDTALFEGGQHTISIVATDTNGNASKPVTINIRFRGSSSGSSSNNSPGIRFTSPNNRATVGSSVQIEAEVSAKLGLATVEWLINGQSVFASPVGGTKAEVSYLWRTRNVPAGMHTITLILTDLTGKSTSANIELRTR